MTKIFLGYHYSQGKYNQAQRLEGTQALVGYLVEHLYASEIRVTDRQDQLIFHARDGVDLYSALDNLGIDLQSIYARVRNSWREKGSQADKEPWEVLYDSIGLSEGEIRMRRRVKAACRAARTAADVVELLEGTYFSAHFYLSESPQDPYYFNPQDFTIEAYSSPDEQDPPKITLDPRTQVRHISSSEDIHKFLLLQAPEPGHPLKP